MHSQQAIYEVNANIGNIWPNSSRRGAERALLPPTRPQAVGCVIILLALFAFVYVVLYYAIKQG